MAKTHAPLAFFFLLVLAAGFITRPAASARCGFNIYVQTGNRNDAGTDATVSLVISGGGGSLTLPNLRSYGTMGGDYDYFERGHLDSFYATSECLPAPPCWMMLSHDNTNNKPGWYVDYVLVITNNGQHHFRVYQWLARDEPPYQLVFVRNDCRGVQGLGGGGGGDSSSMVLVRTTSMPTTSPKLPIAAAATEAATDPIHDDDAAVARESTGSSSSGSSSSS